jgi:hypothetical protein
MFQPKELRVRVFLPGPTEQVVDWERVARICHGWGLQGHAASGDEWLQLVADHTTEQPSQTDTGVDLKIEQDTAGFVVVKFAEADDNELAPNSSTFPKDNAVIAALGFPTEPPKPLDPTVEHGTAREVKP